MKAQFFIISSVIMIYVIVLTLQYLASFSDIRLTGIEELQDFSYIKDIKNSFIETVNTSNYVNNGDINKIIKDVNFTQNFFKQELLKRGIDFDSDFIIFSNGFETGLSAWKVNGSPQLVSNPTQQGSWSLYSNNFGYVTEYLPGMNEVYVKAYVNFNTLPSNSNKHYFMDLYQNGSQILSFGLWNDSGTYRLIINSTSLPGSWSSSGIGISSGGWHYFELYWLENGTSSTLKAWYDGSLDIINQAIASGGKGKLIDQYNFGGTNAVGGTPDLYVDCIAVSSYYTGGNCYPDSQYYFDFNLKTNSMETTTEFSYNQSIQGITTPSSSSCGDSVMCLKFDEGLGNKTYDSSSYGNNGTLGNGNCPGSGTCPTWLSGSNCISGSCLSFDGINDYVNVSNSPSIDFSSPFTISAWIYVNPSGTPSNYRTVLAKSTNTGSVKYGLLIYTPTSGLDFYVNTTSSYSYTESILQNNTWYYVAGVWDGTYITLYVNGNPSTPVNTPGTLPSAATPLLIGSWGGNQLFNGTIDDVRIWSRALSQAEIQAEMTEG